MAVTPDHGTRRRPWRVFWWVMALWLALVGILVVGGWLVLGACGLAWPGGQPFLSLCPTAQAATPTGDTLLEAERRRAAALEDRLESLELALTALGPCTEQCWSMQAEHRSRFEDTLDPLAMTAWEICLEPDGSGGSHRAEFVDGTTCAGPLEATERVDDRLILGLPDLTPCQGSADGMRTGRLDCRLESADLAECAGESPVLAGVDSLRFRRTEPQP